METTNHIDDTIAAITAMHGQAERSATVHQRWIERLTQVIGRPATLYATGAAVALWAGLNAALGGRAFDGPPFNYLQCVGTVCALLISLMVLITQNRQLKLAEKRARLDLEVNLLAETKIAKVIYLLEELRRDLPNVPNRHDAEAYAMQTRVDPHTLANQLDASVEAEVSSETDAEPKPKP